MDDAWEERINVKSGNLSIKKCKMVGLVPSVTIFEFFCSLAMGQFLDITLPAIFNVFGIFTSKFAKSSSDAANKATIP